MKRIILICLFLGFVCCVIMACKGNETKSETKQPLKKSNEMELPLEKDSEIEQSFECGETIEKAVNCKTVVCGKAVECKKRFQISDDEFISMQISPKKISINSSVYLTIENYTKERIGYGAPFYLEYFNENNWTPIQWDINWIAIGCYRKAGETITSGPMNLYPLIEEYNNSKKGRYRIIKDVDLYDSRCDIGCHIGTYYLCDEFEIE